MLKTQSMRLDYARTFAIIGQLNEKTMQIAAIATNLDQSNVYRHIKRLEESLGIKLIAKTKDGFKLTKDGEFLHPYYERAYNELLLAEKRLIESKDLELGKITIGISNNLNKKLINEKIENFKQKHQKLKIKLVELPNDELFEKLKQFNLDVVIGEIPQTILDDSNFSTHNFYEESYCLLHNLNKDLVLDDLKRYDEVKLIVPLKDSYARAELVNIFRQNNINYNFNLEFSNDVDIKEFALKGYGYGLVPKSLANEFYNIPLNISKNIGIAYIKENISLSSEEFIKEFNN